MDSVDTLSCGSGDHLHPLVNIYGAQPGAYRVMPWIVLVWCCAPIITTFLNPGLLELIRSGVLVGSTNAGFQQSD